jgi:cytochrome c biogenesis protein CcmG/thiol:disulfide interchange protein DsbE
VPKTYVIAANGTIPHRHIGPITRAILRGTLMLIVRDLKSSPVAEATQ